MINNSTHSVEIIRYQIASEQHTAFEQAYAEAGTYLQASPYCLAYQLIHGVEEADNYILIIHWTSVEDHLNGFRKSAEFGPFFSLVKPFYNNIQEMKHYQPNVMGWTHN